jgi:transposase, IS30 family
VQPGIGTVAACKAIGIGRKTGYRWRAENGGLPPARLAGSARSGRYLSLPERQRTVPRRVQRRLATDAPTAVGAGL